MTSEEVARCGREIVFEGAESHLESWIDEAGEFGLDDDLVLDSAWKFLRNLKDLFDE